LQHEFVLPSDSIASADMDPKGSLHRGAHHCFAVPVGVKIMREINVFFGVLSMTFLLFPTCVVLGLKIAFWLAAKLSGIEPDQPTYDPTTSTRASRVYSGRRSTQGSTLQRQDGDTRDLR
jgi:hypothetical protein